MMQVKRTTVEPLMNVDVDKWAKRVTVNIRTTAFNNYNQHAGSHTLKLDKRETRRLISALQAQLKRIK